MENGTRRYDLDQLRVLAFGVLILYHVSMFYVADWGWHIKSDRPSEALKNLMLLTSPWRMSLLFFLSGAALAFASRKISRGGLVKLRLQRLVLPLVFSMAVIVPPQVYVELLTKEGAALSYSQFYTLYLDAGTSAYPEHQHGPLGLWTWNHLWFLAYLWHYTLLFVVAKPLLDRGARFLADRPLSLPVIIGLCALPLLAYRYFLLLHWEPSNALVDDWFNHARYLTVMFLGYVLATHDGFWRVLGRHRWHLLGAAIIAYAGLLLMYHGVMLQGKGQFFLRQAWVSADATLWLLAVLGLGHHYLNRPSRVMRYMNEAILPLYILHQTLIVVIAFYLAPSGLPLGLEAALILAGTVAGCALGYEIIRRFWITRLLFGLKLQVKGPRQSTASTAGAATRQKTIAKPTAMTVAPLLDR